MKEQKKKWNFIIGNNTIRFGLISLSRWRELGYPIWAWLHSFYLYEKVIQITIIGLNLAIKFRK